MENQNDPFIKPLQTKKKKGWLNWLMILLPVILIASGALALWNPGGDGSNYGDEVIPSDPTQPDEDGLFEVSGYSFYELPDNTFGTYIESVNDLIPVAFRLDPRNASVADIEDADAIVDYVLTSRKVYVTMNPTVDEFAKHVVAGAEISRLTGLYNIPTTAAYLEDADPIDPDTPLKTCEDATDDAQVIALMLGDENIIKLEDNCVKVIGKNADDLILSADKLGYYLLGIKV